VCVCALVCVLPVEGRAGGHAPGEALDSQLPEVGDDGEVGGHDGQRVRRVHEEAVFSEDHVAVLTTAQSERRFEFKVSSSHPKLDRE